MPFANANLLGIARPGNLLVKAPTPKVDGQVTQPLILDNRSSPAQQDPLQEAPFQNVNVAPPKFKESNTQVIVDKLPVAGPDPRGYHDSGGAPYSPFLFDPTYLHTDCETGGRNLVAVPDSFGKVWLLMLTGPNGSDLYDYKLLGSGDAVYDPRNGYRTDKGAIPINTGHPDDSHPSASMFTAQSAARADFLDIVQGIHDSMFWELDRNRFYAPGIMPHFNWESDPETEGVSGWALEWQDTEKKIAVCSTTNEHWSFGAGGAKVDYIGPGSRMQGVSLIAGIKILWTDKETGDLWIAQAFGDCTTRVAYLTQMENQSLKLRLIKQWEDAYYNWVAALANAIGDTIKGIINIVIAVFTLNIGGITKAIDQIVGAWYKFADADKALKEAEQAAKDGSTKLQIVDEFKKLAGGKVQYLLDDGTPQKSPPSLTPGNKGGTLSPLVLVGGVLLLAQ